MLGATLVVAAGVALGAVGDLTQKAGKAGCISDTGTGGACVDGTELHAATSIAISPDGKNAYLASQSSGSLTVYNRSATTGALTQKPGEAGCFKRTGTAGVCRSTPGMEAADAVAVSPDGKNVYVATYFVGSVVTFDRNTSTGALTPKAPDTGCISSDADLPGCSDGKALAGGESLAVSPDGENVYVASNSSRAVAILDRDTTNGLLTQKDDATACVSDTGSGPCADGRALDSPTGVVVSNDGKYVY
ncbi:MAG: hypothetical protein QOG41_1114, partial [Thermoleophilaceae bacterium]|nr:hypothetical protein [Thermoleophilaceae bacterium]